MTTILCLSSADKIAGAYNFLRKTRNRQSPRGWTKRFWRKYDQAQQELGKIGVVGVYGVRRHQGEVTRAGHVVDRDRLLREKVPLPAAVDTLDELLLALPKGSPLRFDPKLGFHFYGADICLTAQEQGLPAVVMDSLCYHNSPHVGLSSDFYGSAQTFARKWSHRLPVATSCVLIRPSGRIDVI